MTSETLPLIPHWIGGSPQGIGEDRLEVIDPATGRPIAVLRLADDLIVDNAVAAASTAAIEWRDSTLAQRSQVLFAFRELVSAHRAELAAMITAEHGKALDDAAGEVQRGLEVVEYACGIPTALAGNASESVSRGVDVRSIRRPLGVVAVISPFNFPFMVPMWFVPVAIACGNAVVLKPSEKDPSPSVRVAELWQQAGLPDGVFSVVQGSADAVNALLDHPDVAAVSFVGSTPVAKHVYTRASANGKRVQALGGAKNHMVVLPDADLDAAADAAISAAFGSAGQRCMAISVVVAVEPVADDLLARIAERTRALKVGAGTRTPDLGPVITAAQQQRVVDHINRAERAGAKVVTDGRAVTPDGDPDGYWVGATVLDHVTTDMDVYTEEVFGPVLCVVRAGTFDDALALVNRNPYGNGAALFTRNGTAARRFELDVEAGMVGINIPIPVPAAHFSFGGWKDSLFGDLHAYGADGIRFFTRGKVVTSRWPEPAPGVDLAFPRG
ncbi:MAG TPA: CoA-acylating methylmalonate-semialdehyde dehydrogenase [Mycobacteriales bacterium]|nr:CoA-acylating methylmalonate-semialdehyde dehydrogenase [Mycobacteriales bacterium]